jgi:hypothetical protein
MSFVILVNIHWRQYTYAKRDLTRSKWWESIFYSSRDAYMHTSCELWLYKLINCIETGFGFVCTWICLMTFWFFPWNFTLWAKWTIFGVKEVGQKHVTEWAEYFYFLRNFWTICLHTFFIFQHPLIFNKLETQWGKIKTRNDIKQISKYWNKLWINFLAIFL